jgi:hypothetical protein
LIGFTGGHHQQRKRGADPVVCLGSPHLKFDTQADAVNASPQTRDGDNAELNGGDSPPLLAGLFKETFARPGNIRVHFVGVWLVCAIY